MKEVSNFCHKAFNRFIEQLRIHIEPLIDQPWDDIIAKIDKLAKSFEQDNAWRIKDPVNVIHLQLACLLLAVYRTLIAFFDNKQELLNIMGMAIKQTVYADGVEHFLHERMGISEQYPEKAWDTICQNFKKNGDKVYGKGWVFEQDILDDKRCFVNIRKCLYADFFLDNDASDILYLLCATDYVNLPRFSRQNLPS